LVFELVMTLLLSWSPASQPRSSLRRSSVATVRCNGPVAWSCRSWRPLLWSPSA